MGSSVCLFLLNQSVGLMSYIVVRSRIRSNFARPNRAKLEGSTGLESTRDLRSPGESHYACCYFSVVIKSTEPHWTGGDLHYVNHCVAGSTRLAGRVVYSCPAGACHEFTLQFCMFL